MVRPVPASRESRVLPDLDLPTWVEWLLIAGAVASALAGAVALMTKTGRGLMWVGRRTQDVVIEPALQEAAELRKLIEEIHAEVKPNGGASMRDSVDLMSVKLDRHVDESGEDRADIRRRLEELRRRVDGMEGP